uniref:Type I-G CRISPR Cascade large subunit CSX17 n=1 Tax=Thioalkalivibrio sulfidiphilus (strain HL-EbGR7) TaxID=396588 RepID=UPI002240E455|nr:Chain M, Type I-G CRISPR Cascade large subunit CSX17 [Thioalkalivibrio sulfidiphilus HL-EbGr7]
MDKDMHINEIVLRGCAPTPLAAYLKALGVLRLVCEQVDATAKGWWQDECFMLRTRLDDNDLRRFFIEDYRPTPMLSPWNGGSGFYRKGNETAWSTLEKIITTQAERWRPFRDTAEVMADALEHLKLTEKPAELDKRALLARLRATLDDEFLPWLDAAVLLTDDKPDYPPLLGTGGNDGRLDFTSNYMQRLLEMFDPVTGKAQGDVGNKLESALFARPVPGMTALAIGQFSPGAAGGPNSSTGFDSGAQVNIWDYVLMLEGALLFAATATRRLESADPSALSYPFTVRPSGGGSGAVALGDERPARAEIWMPLWERPASLPELRVLLGEGRVTLNGRLPRDGLDFARAVAKLGTDRGVRAFQRYAFMMRSGKAYLATPLNRFHVHRNPKADLIDQLERGDWLRRFRRAARSTHAPARLQGLAHRLDDALFDLVRVADPRRVQEVLKVLGEVQFYLALSPSLREQVRPVPRLDAHWVEAARDDSHEFRVAAALAGLDDGLPMGVHLAPIDPVKRNVWAPESRLAVWGQGNLSDNLAQVLQRRLLTASRTDLNDKPLSGRCPADEGAVAAFLAGDADERRIAELMAGLACARLPARLPLRQRGASEASSLPMIYALLKPLFVPDAQLREAAVLTPDGCLPLPPALPRLLRAGPAGVGRAVDLARRRRRASGLADAGWRLTPPYPDGGRLLAALMIPVEIRVIKGFIKRLADHKSDEPATQDAS